MASNNKKKVDLTKKVKEIKTTILARFDGTEIPTEFEGKKVLKVIKKFGKQYLQLDNTK